MELIDIALSIVELIFGIRSGARRARRRPSNPARVRTLIFMLVGLVVLCGVCALIGALSPANR